MRYYLLTFILLALSTPLFAHGNDHLGPHQGYIRMSGAFHTEVIPDKRGFKIMLLDINFGNPTILNSSIKATIIEDGKRTHLKCAPSSDYFLCTAGNRLKANKGVLELIPKRQGSSGPAVTYHLPLSLETT